MFSFTPLVINRNRTIHRLLTVPAIFAGLLLSGCIKGGDLSGREPGREPSRLDVTIVADRGILADEKGKVAPLTVRIYELKSDRSFREANLLWLQSHDGAALGSDLLAKKEFSMRPGDRRTLRRKSFPNTTAIGLLVSYRGLPQPHWRVIYKLPPAPKAAWYRIALPSNEIKLSIQLKADGVKLTERSTYRRRRPAP